MVAIRHAHQIIIPDDQPTAARGEVIPTDWNADHVDENGNALSLRKILTANANYYVNNSTGSNSNAGTFSAPFATLQYAWDFLSGNLDLHAFHLIFNLAASATAYTLNATSVFINSGGSDLTISILGASSANTTINNLSFVGTGFGAININKVSIVDTGAGFAKGACVYIQDANVALGSGNAIVSDIVLDGGTAAGYAYIYTFGTGSNLTLDASGGTFTLKGNAARAIWADTLCTNFAIGTFTISGTPTFSTAFAQVDNSASLSGSPIFSGSANGPRFIVATNGTIDFGDAAGTVLPGNSMGQLLSGAQYSGITDYEGNVAGLPTAVKGACAFVTDGTAATVGTTVTGGGGVFMPVYADGTNWRFG